MATRTKREDARTISADSALAGILALLVDEREHREKDRKSAVKTEVLLGNAGLAVDDIAALTGKKPDAIRKAIQRARTS